MTYYDADADDDSPERATWLRLGRPDIPTLRRKIAELAEEIARRDPTTEAVAEARAARAEAERAATAWN